MTVPPLDTDRALPPGAPELAAPAAPGRRVPTGVATGVGSLPGTDPGEAARVVTGELPDFPHLAELPERGPGADLLGRTAALLVDLHVDLQPAGWRLVAAPGREERRAAGYLTSDLDAFAEALDGWTGPVKVAVAGPWTLAAGVDLPRGGRLLGDRGAVRDVSASLAEALTGLVGSVRRLVPGAAVVVQLDEPSLPAVLAGRVATESGLGRLRTVAAPDARDVLAVVVDAAHAAGAPVAVHCCAGHVPLGLVRDAGADAVSLDLSLLTSAAHDALGEAVEAGTVLLLGAVPTAGPYDAPAAASGVRELWRRLGLPVESVAQSVTVTPACGLAGRSPEAARAAYRAVREAARRLVEEPAG